MAGPAFADQLDTFRESGGPTPVDAGPPKAGHHTMRNILRTIVCCASISLASLSASAQFGGKAGFSEAFRPDILPRDMVLIVETLKLEDWQRPIVESLIEDYTASFKTGCDAVREKMVDMAKAQKNGSKSAAGLLAPIESWQQEKRKLFSDFMESVKGQLSDTQRERWPRFERTIRREHALANSDLSGEGVDLLAIARQMQMPPEAMSAAQPAFDEYEVALDKALADRDARIESLMPDFRVAMESMDLEKGSGLQAQIVTARIAVRQAQDEGIERIAAALPAPYGADFRQRALAAGYKEAFQPDPLASFFQVVDGLDDLTAEQKSGIASARSKWDTALASLRDRMLDTIRKDDPNKAARATKSAQARLAAKQGKTAEAPPPDPMVPLRNEKNKLVQETRDSVLALLTAEQKEKITAGIPGLRPPNVQTNPAIYEGGARKNPANAGAGDADAEGEKPARKETVE